MEYITVPTYCTLWVWDGDGGSSIIDSWFDDTPESLKMTPNLMDFQKKEVRASVALGLVYGWANLRVRCRNAPVSQRTPHFWDMCKTFSEPKPLPWLITSRSI